MLPTERSTYSAHVTFGFYRRPCTTGEAARGQQEVPSSRPWGSPNLVESGAVVDEGEDGAAGVLEPGVGGAVSGGDAPSSVSTTRGSAGTSVSAAGGVFAPSVAGEVADGTAVGGAGQLGAGGREAEADEIVEPPPMPPEMEPVPPLVHRSPGERLPPGARLYKGRVYRAEPRHTRSQTRAADSARRDGATAGEGIGATLVLQFSSPPAAPPAGTPRMTRAEARARALVPGMMTVRRAQEDILRAVYDEPAPAISPDDLPLAIRLTAGA